MDVQPIGESKWDGTAGGVGEVDGARWTCSYRIETP